MTHYIYIYAYVWAMSLIASGIISAGAMLMGSKNPQTKAKAELAYLLILYKDMQTITQMFYDNNLADYWYDCSCATRRLFYDIKKLRNKIEIESIGKLS